MRASSHDGAALTDARTTRASAGRSARAGPADGGRAGDGHRRGVLVPRARPVPAHLRTVRARAG